MTQRHPIQNDKTMFITTVTAARNPYFSNPVFAHETVDQIYRTKSIIPFFLYGFVVMPDHVHLLIHVPAPATISNVMRTFKMGLSFQTGISPLWQKRYHIRIAHNPFMALRYIDLNPVRAGMVEYPELYPWSSASGKWDIDELF